MSEVLAGDDAVAGAAAGRVRVRDAAGLPHRRRDRRPRRGRPPPRLRRAARPDARHRREGPRPGRSSCRRHRASAAEFDGLLDSGRSTSPRCRSLGDTRRCRARSTPTWSRLAAGDRPSAAARAGRSVAAHPAADVAAGTHPRPRTARPTFTRHRAPEPAVVPADRAGARRPRRQPLAAPRLRRPLRPRRAARPAGCPASRCAGYADLLAGARWWRRSRTARCRPSATSSSARRRSSDPQRDRATSCRWCRPSARAGRHPGPQPADAEMVLSVHLQPGRTTSASCSTPR